MKVQVGMSDLTSLSERVEGAVGPDRELDAALACVVDPGRAGYWPNPVIPDGALVNDIGIMCRAEAYTASLDSALGLVERVLPGWAWRVEFVAKWRPGGPFYGADLTDGIKPASRRAGPTPALAVLAALLKALRP
jgi:hypothetical protein